MIIRMCKICDKKFFIYKSLLKKRVSNYCSRKCFYIFNDKRIIKQCVTCNKSFKVRRGRTKTAKFCSRSCIKKKIKVICKTCQKEFYFNVCWIKRGQGKFCSPECYGKEYSQERHRSWKGGITSANIIIRTSTKYKKWHQAVLERDKWTCQKCSKHGGKLHVDHIKQFAYYPKLRFDINNGRTLCINCHINTDTYGRVMSSAHYTSP